MVLEVLRAFPDDCLKQDQVLQSPFDVLLLCCLLRKSIQEDLEKNQLYVYEEDGKIGAVFVFFIGKEPDYETSVSGEWTSPKPYGVLHRIAVVTYGKGIASKCIQWCYEQCHCMRGDTGQKNKSMQRLFEKNGFTQCAMIHPWYGEMLGYEKYERRESTNVNL